MGILTIILTILLSIGTYILGLFNGAEMERKNGWEKWRNKKGINAIKRTAKKLDEYEKR